MNGHLVAAHDILAALPNDHVAGHDDLAGVGAVDRVIAVRDLVGGDVEHVAVGLDPLGAVWMKQLIVDLRKQGKTVLMCSHRLEDVQDVCDRIAILSEGELQAYGEVRTLLQDHKVYITDWLDAGLVGLVSAIFDSISPRILARST